MKQLLAAMLLGAAFTAHAAEIQYGNYPPNDTHASHATLLAWSEAGDLHIGRVDAHGQLIATNTIDVPGAELSAPAIASDGQSFLVAFLQLSNSGSQIAAAPIDAAGKLGTVRVYGPAINRPLLIWNRDAYSLWGDQQLFTIDRTGTLLGQTPTTTRDQAVIGSDAQLTFTHYSQPGGFHCGFTWCTTIYPSYSVYWTYSSATTRRSGHVDRVWYATGPPAAATNGSDFMLAWNGLTGVEAIVIRNGEPYSSVLIPAPVDPATSASIASDGAQYLIVYDSFGKTYGAFIGTVDAVVQPFPITTSPNLEAHPLVTALARGRFLVTYKSGATLTGTLLTTPDATSPRRRSVR
jgi:hypothetical protein